MSVPSGSRVFAAVVVLVLIVSAVPLALPLGAAAADGPPAGMSRIPGENVADARAPTLEGDALTDSIAVYASEHASTLNASIVTKEQADAVAQGTPLPEIANEKVCSTPAAGKNPNADCDSDTEAALVLTDDEHTEGRRVALRAAPVREALGHEPSMIAVRNSETGESWTYGVTKEDGWLVVDVEHFSSNSVSFSGEVSIDSTGATDGSSYTYDINDLDAASDPQIELTGVQVNDSEVRQITGATDSSSYDISVAGNKDPPDPTLQFTGVKSTQSVNPIHNSGDGYTDTTQNLYGITGTEKIDSSVEVTPSQDMTVSQLDYTLASLSSGGSGSTITFDVRIAAGGADSNWGEGTKVKDGYSHGWSKSHSISLDSSYSMTAGNTYEVEFITQSLGDSSEYQYFEAGADDSAGSTHFNRRGFDYANYIDITLKGSEKTHDPQVDLGGDGITDAEYAGTLNDGESVNISLSDLTTNTNSFTTSIAGSGKADVNIYYTERTVTEDPAIEVNDGNWINHSGTLSDGSTTTLSGNSTSLQSGTNRVNLSYGASLSADAPAMKADLSYNHSAQSNQSITATTEQWTEAHNVSKTYGYDATDAEYNVSHLDTVVAMRDLEYRINQSGGWSAVSSSDYTLDGNDLGIDLNGVYGGEIPATTTIEIRSNGSKVQTNNVEITVTEPTLVNEDLDSKIRIDSISSDAYIDVGPTDEGDRVHYLYNESWSSSEYVVIDSAGNQEMYLPNAAAGNTARVTHMETKVTAETGDVKIEVLRTGENPEIDVAPGPGGSGDTVTVEYYRTTSGVKYLLNSITRSIVVDSDVAESPAIFEDDDSSETWEILKDDSGSSSSDDTGANGGGPVQAAGQFAQTGTGAIRGVLTGPLGLVALLAVGVLGAVVVGRRVFGGDGDSSAGGTPSRSTDSGGMAAGIVSGAGDAASGLASGVASGAVSVGESGVDVAVDAGDTALNRPRLLTVLGVIGLVTLVALDVIELPEGGATLLLIAGIPLVTYVALKMLGQYSLVAFGTIAGITTLVGLQLLGGEVVAQILDALGPVIPLVAMAGIYLAYQALQAAQAPDEQNTVTLDIDDEEDE